MEKKNSLKEKFLCPHCRTHLRLRDNIIFKVEIPSTKQMGLLLLNSELGNYNYISQPDAKFKEGEKVEFYCPVCCANLKAKGIDENLVMIKMLDSENKEYDIYFSKITGVHTTFKIEKHNIIEHFGDNKSEYLRYFTARLKMNLEG
ncbi:MAG: hypothetical protein K9H64_12460 [Bacteroidales bacterium]|nr:hypothetical protein [Bacteroidales bacterium]MCF8456857.1 hypothetical protein [Bacteroidales bacterium]